MQFIQSAQKTLDCAIYDLKDSDVVSALKSVANKVTLRIAYDGGKQKMVTGGPSLDPKPKGTAQIIEDAGLSKYATPIQPILILSETLKTRVTDSEGVKMTDIINRNAIRLQQLSEDVLDITRIETHSLKINKSQFDSS